ncbi:alpha-N-acetylglucosaminidase [Mucilaginibacter lappiensis]|uniref:Alpha-N-acetylglucosaminidase n=1 Tax=Mucilaginibacter lappiensis TaxID=354630 RepID=A0ABR6PDT2_9SPHI|nr:alpha-N-acetylglucosaminidase [Mucilaginibacter lappiensis]MBB6107915.1 alpha-N-acetylglucosaminidase [Mucilaginibacter lappiensis]SIP92702.1 alpha-N-acetylglucosaminidase [Mucilaginibacter lappiensis]
MRKHLLVLVVIAFGLKASAQVDQKASYAFIERVIPGKSSSFTIEAIPQQNGKDVFELDSRSGKIVLRGNNGLSIASALNYYLKKYCLCDISWNGINLNLPATLPMVKSLVHKTTPYQYRYYLNYCTYNYSMAWWDWDRWQREIDWMALNGINLPLAITGEEAVWQNVYKSMGFTDKQLDEFFSGPAYFAWFWMGNIDAWGGPLPQHWMDTHKELQKKILERERSFGMKPVLSSFTGHVPPSFKDKFPGAKIKKTNWDAGFPDVYILDPDDPMFETIGKKYIEAQTKEFGTDHLYSADTFNENVPPTNDSTYLDGMSKKVFNSMAAADPKAIWVMQGWMFHYNNKFWQPQQIKALLNAVPNEQMIVLDLYSDAHPVWNRTEAYYGKPWIWSMLQNFGGNISLFGRMRHVAADPAIALHDPESKNMRGIGITPEGIEQNPALFALMLENVWNDTPIDVDKWLVNYAQRRYGQNNTQVNEAWHILLNTVYSGGLTEGGPESIIVARPTFKRTIDRVLTKVDYDPAQLLKAWGLFINATDSLKQSDGFQYDLADITRQVLANYASPLQQQMVAAYQSKDKANFKLYSTQFLQLMDDMDALLSTRKDFLLGKWITEARVNGITEKEKNLYEFNARDLVTLWGDKESGLREYSNRQWAGLIKGYYKPRWELFLDQLNKSLISGAPFDEPAFDKQVKDWEWQWVNKHDNSYSDATKGNSVDLSKQLFGKYHTPIQQAYIQK